MTADIYHGGSMAPENTIANYAAAQLARQAVAQERLARQSFDISHPVDEYISSDGIPNQTPTSEFGQTFDVALELTRTWDLPERIESYLVTIPIGTVVAWLKLADRWISLYGAAGTITQPAVPGSTVAQQNTNSFPVQVVITGGTITAVVVNGVTVGAGAGTYTVPAYGSISITYSAAPTWVWSVAPTNQPLTFTENGLGLILNQNDDRLLLLNGALTQGPTHFELMGFAHEIYGNA